MRVNYKWLLVSLAAIVLIGATTVTYKQNQVKEVNLNNQIEQLKEQSKARSEADKQKLQKRELELQQQVRELNEKLQSKAAEKARVAAVEAAKKPIVSKVVQTVVPTAQAATGSHIEWMAAAGISPSDYQYVEYIVQKESGWRYTAVNAGSGATGLCQSLPASKMATAGGDYLTNPVTQLRWCNSYAQARYGGWAGAYQFWISRHWW